MIVTANCAHISPTVDCRRNERQDLNSMMRWWPASTQPIVNFVYVMGRYSISDCWNRANWMMHRYLLNYNYWDCANAIDLSYCRTATPNPIETFSLILSMTIWKSIRFPMCDDRLLYRMHCLASPPQPHLANCRKRFVLTTYSLNLADFRTINLMMKFYVGLWDLICSNRMKRKKRENKFFR